MEANENPASVQNAANRILSMMDGTPSEEPKAEPEVTDDTHPEPLQQAPDAPEQETTDIESETTEDDPIEEPVTHFRELADHLNVEESFLDNLIVPAKVNGEERNPTIKDLIANYQKGESADGKLQEIAQQRKQMEAQLSEKEQNLAQELARLQAMEQEWQNLMSGDDQRDLEILRHSDPAEYAARIAERQQRMERAENLRRQSQELNAQKSYETYSRMVETERNRLLTEIPEWQDEKTAAKETADIRSYLKNNGFQDWEIDGKMDNGVVTHTGIIDHRAISLARKAMLYDKAKTSSEPKKTKLTSLPKVGSGKRLSKADQATQQRTELRQKARQTGSVDDAAKIIAQIMGN